jgi:UDP-glucose 4-epimerase
MTIKEQSKHFVTGGAGFIGSHLVERILADGNEVTAYDNLSSGKKENLETCFENTHFKFIQDDLLNCDALNKAAAGHTTVWHLGANTDIQKGNQSPDYDLQNGTIATFNVLKAMRINKINQIGFASSSTVYGESSSTVLSETYGPLLPISLYGAGKLAGEAFISAYSHLYGIKAVIFRFANVIGTRMGHGVIHDFIKKLKNNNTELEILGDGTQEKPYFLVEDCVEGMLIALEKTSTSCEVYNLGNDSSTSVKKVAEIVVEEMLLKNVTFKYTGGKRGWPGDIPVVHYNVKKIKRLGWNSKHSSDDAVQIATKRLLND